MMLLRLSRSRTVLVADVAAAGGILLAPFPVDAGSLCNISRVQPCATRRQTALAGLLRWGLGYRFEQHHVQC